MRYFLLEPEVGGGVGPETVMDTSVHPPRVDRLHYEMDTWLGDDLLTTFPCYIVTERLEAALRRLAPSGGEFGEVLVTASETFRDFHPRTKLPRFVWLKVVGRPGVDDLGMSQDHLLVVSERVLDELKRFHLEHCDIAEYFGA